MLLVWLLLRGALRVRRGTVQGLRLGMRLGLRVRRLLWPRSQSGMLMVIVVVLSVLSLLRVPVGVAFLGTALRTRVRWEAGDPVLGGTTGLLLLLLLGAVVCLMMLVLIRYARSLRLPMWVLVLVLRLPLLLLVLLHLLDLALIAS